MSDTVFHLTLIKSFMLCKSLLLGYFRQFFLCLAKIDWLKLLWLLQLASLLKAQVLGGKKSLNPVAAP